MEGFRIRVDLFPSSLSWGPHQKVAPSEDPLFLGFKLLEPGLAEFHLSSGLSMAIPQLRGLASKLMAQVPLPRLPFVSLPGAAGAPWPSRVGSTSSLCLLS